ncbi:MAG: hypothetical protein ACFCU3_09060 [Verrucomicrobiales bacterium]
MSAKKENIFQRFIGFVLGITLAIVHDQDTRRKAMFMVVLSALILLFLGATLFFDFLKGGILRFLAYWLLVAWLTICALLLAIYDLLMLRTKARMQRRDLASEIFADLGEPDQQDPEAADQKDKRP